MIIKYGIDINTMCLIFVLPLPLLLREYGQEKKIRGEDFKFNYPLSFLFCYLETLLRSLVYLLVIG